MALVALCSVCRGDTTVGKVYDIAEKNAYEELMKRVNAKDWTAFKSRLSDRIKSYSAPDLPHIPTARESRVFFVDMTYTLEYDITDAGGNVLYHKGFQFNPLNYIDVQSKLCIINAEDPDQIEWYMKSEHKNDLGMKLLITQGSYYEMIKKLKRPVFIALKQIIDKFKITKTPSVVRQVGDVMEVREYAIPRR